MFTLRNTFYLLIKKTTKLSLIASVVGASVLSAASYASGLNVFETIDMNQRADNERPGARVDDYLGQNVGPEFWQDENHAVEQSIAACMEKRGHKYSVHPDKTSAKADEDAFGELAANDPRRFEKTYGYGIAAGLQQEAHMRQSAAAKSASSSADKSADKSKVMTKDYADAQDACASLAVNKIIRPKLAPKEVHEAYRALLAQAAKT